MEFVDINTLDVVNGISPEIPQSLDSIEPSKEWLESQAAYLELTSKRTDWKLNFPSLQMIPADTVELETRNGYAYMVRRINWRVTFQVYEGNIERSYSKWPTYTHFSFLYQIRNKVNQYCIVVKTDSGSAIYYKVWRNNSYIRPVYALWKSTGTIKPKQIRKKKEK